MLLPRRIIRVLCSPRTLVTSELEVIFSPNVTLLVSSNGLSTSAFRDKRPSSCSVSRFPQPSTSSLTPSTRTKVRNNKINDKASKLLKMLAKYSPETKQVKKLRLKTAAEQKDQKKTDKPLHLKFGLNHVTTLVE